MLSLIPLVMPPHLQNMTFRCRRIAGDFFTHGFCGWFCTPEDTLLAFACFVSSGVQYPPLKPCSTKSPAIRLQRNVMFCRWGGITNGPPTRRPRIPTHRLKWTPEVLKWTLGVLKWTPPGAQVIYKNTYIYIYIYIFIYIYRNIYIYKNIHRPGTRHPTPSPHRPSTTPDPAFQMLSRCFQMHQEGPLQRSPVA